MKASIRFLSFALQFGIPKINKEMLGPNSWFIWESENSFDFKSLYVGLFLSDSDFVHIVLDSASKIRSVLFSEPSYTSSLSTASFKSVSFVLANDVLSTNIFKASAAPTSTKLRFESSLDWSSSSFFFFVYDP